MVAHIHLPKNPQNDADLNHWHNWAASASGAELFEAFLHRMNHLSRASEPDLDPTQRLLASRLREQLQGGPA